MMAVLMSECAWEGSMGFSGMFPGNGCLVSARVENQWTVNIFFPRPLKMEGDGGEGWWVDDWEDVCVGNARVHAHTLSIWL